MGLRVIPNKDAIGMSKAARERSWKQFLSGGTGHSGLATTLSFIIERCEEEGVSYQLTAHPGKGYHMQPIEGL